MDFMAVRKYEMPIRWVCSPLGLQPNQIFKAPYGQQG